MFTRFEDIDGNSFSLVGFDDVSHALEEQRRAIAEKLESERRAAQELEIARMVQARLFPQTLPPFGTLEYAGVCVQARQVGGDYYDFLNLGQERLGLVVGDIAGKGIAAALLMANLQANLRSQCAIALEHPQRFLESVNQLFFENTIESAYATLFFAEYDNRARRSALRQLRPSARVSSCAATARSIGWLPPALFWGSSRTGNARSAKAASFPGDTLVLYTDGVTEAFNDRARNSENKGWWKACGAISGLRPQALDELHSRRREAIQPARAARRHHAAGGEVQLKEED